MTTLRYVPFESVVDMSFWHGLANRKLNDYQLSEGPFDITAQFSNNQASGISPRISVDITSFADTNVKRSLGSNSFNVCGQMYTFNTLEKFRNIDKQAFINEYGRKNMEELLHNEEYLKSPDLLNKFLFINFCDLKKFKFYFWFAYPAVLHSVQPKIICSRRLDEEFTVDQISSLISSYDLWRKDHKSSLFAFHMVPSPTVHSFIEFKTDPNCFIGLCDSSVDCKYPSWFLRNVLYALKSSIIKETQTVKVICLRDRITFGKREIEHSLVLHLELNCINDQLTQFVGWEKWKDQLKPRVVDLSNFMDPTKLAESAVDLNLKLMKWRLMPDLKLTLFRDTKCLLIGAGTLGCNVARQLLAWGVRQITFVDNGFVSPSNPVRQSLFVYNDAIKEGKNKAIAASESLKAIFPGVQSQGIELSIPMPGHPVPKHYSGDCASTDLQSFEMISRSCQLLNDLIHSHDVIFLLTDTRESRWLPTLLANINGKFVINAALGFDSYLVMRHGLNSPGLSPSFTDVNSLCSDLTLNTNVSKKKAKPVSNKKVQKVIQIIPGTKLGCYFCNDVVGPTNSTLNRTMDQQCTVTRPGVSMIASALAVELMVTTLQHPLGYSAPADTSDNLDQKSGLNSSLGLVPHQIRGFLSSYSQVLPANFAFDKCSACSQQVLDAYKTSGLDFLVRVFDDSSYLEQLCGLSELQNNVKEDSIILLDDSE